MAIKVSRFVLVITGILFFYLTSGGFVFHARKAAHALGLHYREVRIAARIAENYRLRGDSEKALEYIRVALDAVDRMKNRRAADKIRNTLASTESRIREAVRDPGTAMAGKSEPKLGGNSFILVLKNSWQRFRAGRTRLDDAAFNFSLFFFVGILFLCAWGTPGKEVRLWRVVLIFVVIAVYSTCVELGQFRSPPRTPDGGDIFYNSTGAFVGACLAMLVRRIPLRSARNSTE
jgi:hypothetical protein